MRIAQRITLAKVSPSEFISAFETEWNRITHLSRSSAAASSTYWKIGKDLFACQEAKRDFLLVCFTESYNNVVETLSSKDHLTYQDVKEHILNLPTNHRSLSGASSKNSKPQHEANAVFSTNGKKDKKKKIGSSSSSKSGSKECNWCRPQSPGTACSHIWTLCKELKARRDRNGTETAAPVQEVTNTISSNSSK
jgi:hypothetical protein